MNKSIIFFIILILLVIVSFFAYKNKYFVFEKEQEKNIREISELIKKQKIVSNNEDQIFSETKELAGFFRGTLLDGKTFVYALKTVNGWNVINVSEEKVSCEKYQKLGFSKELISDCYTEYPSAKSASDFIQEISNNYPSFQKITNSNNIYNPDTVSSKQTSLGLKGIVVENLNSNCNCVSVSSDGQTIEFSKTQIESVLGSIPGIGDFIYLDTVVKPDEKNKTVNVQVVGGESILDKKTEDKVFYPENITEPSPTPNQSDTGQVSKNNFDRDFSSQSIILLNR